MNERKTVCIASVPEREILLCEVLKSLLPQVDNIMLYLNNYSVETAEKIKGVDPKKISYVIGDNSIGDAGKFFFTPKLTGYVFTCDDDILYPFNYINGMISAIERYKRTSVVSSHGRIFDFPVKKYYHGFKKHFAFNRQVMEDTQVHVIGTGCMGWHSDTVKGLSMDAFKSKNMSDIHFSIFAEKNGIPLRVIRHSGYWLMDLQAEKTIYSEMSVDDSEHVRRLNEINDWEIL